MKHLIDKDALVAEIEARIKRYDTPTDGMGSNYSHQHECKEILSFINTLEVKEVDLEKEVELWYNEYAGNLRFDWNGFAKHFFELGLNAKQS